jgi:hypothetical protein
LEHLHRYKDFKKICNKFFFIFILRSNLS